MLGDDVPTLQCAFSIARDAPASFGPMRTGTLHSELGAGPGSYGFVPAPSVTACFQAYVYAGV